MYPLQVCPTSLEGLNSIENPDFSFDLEVHASLLSEKTYAALDLGPTDALPDDQRILEYDLFYGPLSSSESAPPSPSPSRSASPTPTSKPPPATSSDTGRLPPWSGPSNNNALPSGKSKQRRNKLKSHKNRRAERQNQRDARREGPYEVRSTTFLNHVSESSATKTNFNIEQIPIASTGYIALPDKDEGKILEAGELVRQHGFRYIPWDGDDALPITDSNGLIIAVPVGRPRDADWNSVHKGAFSSFSSSRRRCKFPSKSKQHRRGDFPVLSCGISHGGGQTKPGNLCNSATNAKQLDELLKNANIQRIAGFSSSAFATWAPKLYMYYEDHLEKLLDHDPSLSRNFPNSIWSAAAFNFGPHTVTRRHRDFANLPFGWCAITSLGNFDPKRGGHLVLWTLKLVIEFPPGSTILVPSAAIPHSNTPISRREQRASFTQYSAGGLFRWVDQGFKLKEQFMANLTPAEEEEELKGMEERRRLGLSLFSTLKTLPADQTLFNARI